jgi:hypothetical protein
MSDQDQDEIRDGVREVVKAIELLDRVTNIYRDASGEMQQALNKMQQLVNAEVVVGQPNEPDQWSEATYTLEERALIRGEAHFEALAGGGKAELMRKWAAEENERGGCTTHPCYGLEENDTTTSGDPILQALANGEVIIPGGRLVAAAFFEGLLAMELDHRRNWLRIAYLRQGWDEGLAREKVDAFLRYVKEWPLLFFYGMGWMPPKWRVDKRELQKWLPLPEHLMRQETTLRPMAEKAPDLFTSATAAEVEKREKMLARAMLSDKDLQSIAVSWDLTPEEMAVHYFLRDRFAMHDYLRTKLELRPGEILDGCGWKETKDDYRRLKEAIHRLRTIPRLRAYKHTEDREELLGKTKRGKPQRPKMGAFVNTGPLWDVTPFYVDGGDRVLYYTIRPMGNLFHHVNTTHQGQPAFYRWERAGLLPMLSQVLQSGMDAAQAGLLLSAIKSAKQKADPDGWLVFDYKETAMQLQVRTMGKLPTRGPRDEREEKIRERIQELVAHGQRDKDIAENLSAAMGETITRAEAKKLRERLVGGSLPPKEPTEPRKLRPKLERLLKAAQGTQPEFLLEWSLPERGPRWSVRIAAQWTPSSKVATPTKHPK